MGQDMSGGAEGDMFTGEYEQMSPLREQVFTSCFFLLFFIRKIQNYYFQDRFLPIANVSKIMKKPIPETGKVFNIES